MRYIESAELREWVKENLRKTIFQKAHALAVQTGCEVLVKLHDTTDIENCQFYGTRYLKRIYQSSKLRQPGETLVSGETGLPLRDKCIQSNIDAGEEAGERLMESGFDAADEMELNTTNTQTQAGNTSLDTNSQVHVQIKTEPDDMELQEHVEEPELTVNTEKSSELESPTSVGVGPGTSTPTISRMQPVMFTNVQRHTVPISPKPYQCSICQKTFRSVQILHKHTLTFHSRPKTKSPMSRGRGKGRGKGHGSQYFRHQLSQDELEPRGYHCVMCNQSFLTQDILQDHVTHVHSIPSAAAIPTDQDNTTHEQSNDHPTDPNQSLSAVQTSELEDGTVPGASTSEGTPGIGSMFKMESPSSFDMSQGSPSAFNMSSASTSSTMSMGQSSPRRPGRHGPKSGARTWKWKKHQTIVKTNTVNQFIMEAILLTPGPVSTRTAVNTSGPRFLRGSISNQQFQQACFNLQNANLGYLASMTGKSTNTPGTKVFIKKKPEAALEHLLQHGFCTVDEYNKRYETKAPKCISQKLIADVIGGGLVTADQFKGRVKMVSDVAYEFIRD